jgi:hypothetical protein
MPKYTSNIPEILLAWMAGIGIVASVHVVAYIAHEVAAHVEIRWVESTPSPPDRVVPKSPGAP